MKGEDVYKEVSEEGGAVSSMMKSEIRELIEKKKILQRKVKKSQDRMAVVEARLKVIRGMTLEEYAKEKEPQKVEEKKDA